jgi:hypothetical protein
MYFLLIHFYGSCTPIKKKIFGLFYGTVRMSYQENEYRTTSHVVRVLFTDTTFVVLGLYYVFVFRRRSKTIKKSSQLFDLLRKVSRTSIVQRKISIHTTTFHNLRNTTTTFHSQSQSKKTQ